MAIRLVCARCRGQNKACELCGGSGYVQEEATVAWVAGPNAELIGFDAPADLRDDRGEGPLPPRLPDFAPIAASPPPLDAHLLRTTYEAVVRPTWPTAGGAEPTLLLRDLVAFIVRSAQATGLTDDDLRTLLDVEIARSRQPEGNDHAGRQANK